MLHRVLVPRSRAFWGRVMPSFVERPSAVSGVLSSASFEVPCILTIALSGRREARSWYLPGVPVGVELYLKVRGRLTVGKLYRFLARADCGYSAAFARGLFSLGQRNCCRPREASDLRAVEAVQSQRPCEADLFNRPLGWGMPTNGHPELVRIPSFDDANRQPLSES